MHYVQLMIETVLDQLSDEEVSFYHKVKRNLYRRDQYILCEGQPCEIDAGSLLWQNYDKYDQIGHAYLAWQLWIGVVSHPRILSCSFSVGGVPGGDKADEYNNQILAKASGPFKAKFIGGPGYGDGYVEPLEGSFYKNGSIPLEVGAVAPANLIHHLLRGGAFARWPYDSKFVYVFELPKDLMPIKSLSSLVGSHLKECKQCNDPSYVESSSMI